MANDRLPGDELEIPDGVSASDAVVVATVETVPPRGGGDAPGCSWYSPFRAWVTTCVKGDLHGEIEFGLEIQTFPVETAEAVPAAGTSYIFFLSLREGTWTAIKVLHPTPDNLRTLRRADRLKGTK